jgi:hypothetical protein
MSKLRSDHAATRSLYQAVRDKRLDNAVQKRRTSALRGSDCIAHWRSALPDRYRHQACEPGPRGGRTGLGATKPLHLHRRGNDTPGLGRRRRWSSSASATVRSLRGRTLLIGLPGNLHRLDTYQSEFPMAYVSTRDPRTGTRSPCRSRAAENSGTHQRHSGDDRRMARCCRSLWESCQPRRPSERTNSRLRPWK